MPEPEIEWVEGRLRSKRFRDIYFAHDGPTETQRVFAGPAQIASRVRASSIFTIMEFGFGTGLNFLSIAQSLLAFEHRARVRYISAEKYPLQSHDIKRALTPFKTDLQCGDELLNQLPPRIAGWHRRYFCDGRLELSLYYGDVADAVNDLVRDDRRGIDAWFLDGFAPDRNPDMWDPAIFARMHGITNAEGTVSTFSAAGRVRRALSANGFDVLRVEGGSDHKRHTTLGVLAQSTFKPINPPATLRVIGGGLAGTAVARTLANKGVQVKLVERAANVGEATSAIPAAIQHPRLSAAATLLAHFRIHAYSHAQATLDPFSSVNRSGAIHLPDSGMNIERLSHIANLLGSDWSQMLDARDMQDRSSSAINSAGAWYPKSAIVNGHELCRELVEHDRIEVVTGNEADMRDDESVPTVFATGCDMPQGIGEMPLEAIVIAGQVDAFGVGQRNLPLQHVVVSNGYVAPRGPMLYAGSTYEYEAWPTGEATRSNQTRITDLLPNLQLQHQTSFRARRVVTSDRLPIVGSINSNCWASWAHGSGGTITAPFAAELIASEILSEIAVGITDMKRLLSPDRFRLRQLRRPDPLTRGFRTSR